MPSASAPRAAGERMAGGRESASGQAAHAELRPDEGSSTRIPPGARAGSAASAARAGPGARPAQPMGAALGTPPPHREEPAQGCCSRGRARRAAPGPCVPGPRRAAWMARRPRKEAGDSVLAPNTHAAPSRPPGPEPNCHRAPGPG